MFYPPQDRSPQPENTMAVIEGPSDVIGWMTCIPIVQERSISDASLAPFGSRGQDFMVILDKCDSLQGEGAAMAFF